MVRGIAIKYIVSVLMVAALMAATYNRNEIWASSYTLWSDAAAKAPDKARPHVNLGIVFFQQKSFDEAEKELLRAISIKPYYPTALQYLGFISVKKGDIHKAIEYYRTAISRYPEIAETWYYMGHELESLGRYEEAEAAYRKALSLNYDFMLPVIRLGHLLEKQGRQGEMRELLIGITRNNPQLLQEQPYLRTLIEGGFERPLDRQSGGRPDETSTTQSKTVDR